jgi:hypothetical protein
MGAAHFPWQTPWEQTWSGAHAVSQLPQCIGSFASRAHPSSQRGLETGHSLPTSCVTVAVPAAASSAASCSLQPLAAATAITPAAAAFTTLQKVVRTCASLRAIARVERVLRGPWNGGRRSCLSIRSRRELARVAT